jgi:NTE family protein
VGDYHYVVVDLPNEMDDVVLQTLIQSDLVHLITFVKKNDLDLVRRVIDRLETRLKQNFKEEKIRVIVRQERDKSTLSFEEINKFIDYHVYTDLPVIEDTGAADRVESASVSFARGKKRSHYHRVVTRIAREIGGVLVGLVLGGGAALGISHIGVLKVLEEEDIPIDIVAGSSMGALVGSLWVTGKNAREMTRIASAFNKKRNMLKLMDWPVIPVSGFISGRAVKRWLRKHLGNKTFYSTRIPFKVVAYDLIRRQELVLNGGSLVDAVRQSISIPGVFKPIIRGEQVIIDGGVMNPLPTNVMAQNGIQKVIAVNVLQSPEDVTKSYELFRQRMQEERAVPFHKAPFHYVSFRVSRFFERLFRPNIADIIVFTLQAAEYVIAEQSAEQADVNIHPNVFDINWYELYKVDELIKVGEQAARAALPEIKALIAK